MHDGNPRKTKGNCGQRENNMNNFLPNGIDVEFDVLPLLSDCFCCKNGILSREIVAAKILALLLCQHILYVSSI